MQATLPNVTTTHPRGWPFMAAPAHHDKQLSDQGVAVPTRQEIEFKDGKRIWLSRVIVTGAPDTYLRELGEPARGARIDLRRFIADLEKELPRTSTRDVAGYVAYSLRLAFETRDAFLEAVVARGVPA